MDSEAKGKPASWIEWRASRDRAKLPVEALWAEWLLENVNYYLASWALLDVLARLAQLSILVAVVSYLVGAPERAKQRQYAAWAVIAQGYGKSGPLGRREALQDLQAESVELSGIDLRYAWLQFLVLPGATLSTSVFDSATLRGANLTGSDLSRSRMRYSDLWAANLTHSNLSRANLAHANMDNARFDSTNMRDAILDSASLQSGHLVSADLGKATLRRLDAAGADGRGAILTKMIADSSIFSGALLQGANIAYSSLKGANLESANLAGATLFKADLQGARLGNSDLTDTDLAGADLRFTKFKDVRNWRKVRRLTAANIYGVQDAPAGFAEWAIDSMGAVAIVPNTDWIYLRVLRGIRWQAPSTARWDSTSQ